MYTGYLQAKPKKQLDLGHKFLIEQDYEQAIVSFKKALKIDPLNENAYLGMADAYVGMGDFEEAKAVLENAKILFEEKGMDADILINKLTIIYLKEEQRTENGSTGQHPEDSEANQATETLTEELVYGGNGELPKVAEEIVEKLYEAGKFAWDIFGEKNIPYIDPNDVIVADYIGLSWNYYRVAIDGVSSIQDMKEYTMQNYFDPSTTNKLMDFNQWIERNGSLYVNEAEGLGGGAFDDYSLYISRTSDNTYMISAYYLYEDNISDASDTFNCTVKDGSYIFDNYKCPVEIVFSCLDVDPAKIKNTRMKTV